MQDRKSCFNCRLRDLPRDNEKCNKCINETSAINPSPCWEPLTGMGVVNVTNSKTPKVS